MTILVFLDSCSCLVMPARSVGRSVDKVEIGSRHLSFDIVGRRRLASLRARVGVHLFSSLAVMSRICIFHVKKRRKRKDLCGSIRPVIGIHHAWAQGLTITPHAITAYPNFCPYPSTLLLHRIISIQRTFRLPPVMVTLTKRRVYFRRFMARPLGFFFFSWASTCIH